MAELKELGGHSEARVRHWGAKLCLAEGEADSRRILCQAYLELGFTSVAAVRRDATGGASILWHSVDAAEQSMQNPLTAAIQDALTSLDPLVNRWIMRQNRMLSHEDLLEQGGQTFQDLMQLPRLVGRAPWRTLITVSHRIGSRYFSVDAASRLPYAEQIERLDDVRFLAQLFFATQTTAWGEPDCRRDERTQLQPKQVECLRWAAAGKAYHDIADIIGISPRTVRFHLDSARMRYGYATITQTIVQAAKDFDLDPLDAR